MARLWMILLLAIGGASLSAQVFLEYEDSTYLRDYETARYRIDLDYGADNSLDIRIIARGISAPPRVRVLDSDKDILTNRTDNGADGILDFTFHAFANDDDTFYIDLTHKYGAQSGTIELTLQVRESAGQGADATINFDRYFNDYHRPEDRNDCSTGAGTGTSALLALLALAAGALWFRHRGVLQRARA